MIERTETVQPCGGALSRSHSNFQSEDFLWQLFVAVEILQQRPEIGDGIRDRFRMIGIRRSARQCFFESVAGSAFPQRKVLPEKIVESPDDAGTNRAKRFQVNPLARFG